MSVESGLMYDELSVSVGLPLISCSVFFFSYLDEFFQPKESLGMRCLISTPS